MGRYKKRGRGKGRGRGRGSCSSSSSSSVEPQLDDEQCRALGFDGYDPNTGMCINIANA